MENKHLYSELQQYCREALALLKREVGSSQRLPLVRRETVKCDDRGSWLPAYAPKVEWYRLVDNNTQNFKRMKSCQKAQQAMRQDSKIAVHLNNLVGTANSSMRIDEDECLRALLIQYLEEQQHWTFQKKAFNQVYRKIEKYFYKKTLEYRFFSLLGNFEMDAERIRLDSNLFIIKISKKERQDLWLRARSLSGSAFSQLEVMSSKCALVFYLQVPKIIGSPQWIPPEKYPSNIVRKRFDEVCSALRLFKEGNISYNSIQMKATTWEPYGAINSFGPLSKQYVLGSYRLLKDEIRTFRSFWRFYQRTSRSRSGSIGVAIRRFNFAYERTRQEDKFIDYLISLEALLFKKDEKQELSYKLALRGSVLMGKNYNTKKEICDLLRAAYKERSNIVHGGTSKAVVTIAGHKIQFNDLVNRLEKYLRCSIRKFLALLEKKSEKEIIDSLDEKIIK